MDPNLRSTADRQLTLRVAAIACVISCLLVALDLWDKRDVFDPEGITYLDMADAYRRGDWRAALVGLWSPLYAWLLALMILIFEPSAQWEFTAVNALNFFIYLIALASFSVFMRELLRANKETALNPRIPDWCWLALGYALFTWSVIRLIPPHQPEPDLFVCALVYLIFALLFRIRMGIVTWGESICLGVVLALGYLAKAVMFPMAFVFTGVALLLAGRSAPKRYRVLASFAVFLSLALPYVVLLSNANGRWMFSDAGRLNYMWEINQVKGWSHWQGEDAVHGTPVHPTRKIHDDPPMYEFATPFKVTYPPWYDPSYWYEGVDLTVDLQRQLSVIGRNIRRLLFFLANSTGSATGWPVYGPLEETDTTIGPLLTAFCVMVVATLGRASVFRRIAEHWFVLVPIGAVLGAYALLHFEGRYIAAYVVVLWMVLFRSVAVAHSEESKKFFAAVLASVALIAVMTLATGTARAVWHAARDLAKGNNEAPLLQSGYTNWKVAQHLHAAGLRAGDPVGSVGWTYSAYWARMARLHVVAEVPSAYDGATASWFSAAAKRAIVMQLFREVGAKAVVAKDLPPGSAPADWQRVGDTAYYVHVFPTNEAERLQDG